MERNTEKLKLARIALKRLQTSYKHRLYTHQKRRVYVIIFSLILNYSVQSLYSHTNSYNNAVTQCHVDGAQRAWATCGLERAQIFFIIISSSLQLFYHFWSWFRSVFFVNWASSCCSVQQKGIHNSDCTSLSVV